MEDRRTLSLVLGANERRQLLVESGTVLMVAEGDVVVGQSVDWVNGRPVQVVQRLLGEDIWTVDAGGWIEVRAVREAQLVVIPPDRVSFWQLIGGRLEAWFSGSRASGRGAG